MEILSLSWSNNSSSLQNYLTFPEVLPTVLSMLKEQKLNPEVYDLHFLMLKSLISKCLLILTYFVSEINLRLRRQKGCGIPL